MSKPFLVLPRPGEAYTTNKAISAPSESAFTSKFGRLLPAASYLQTEYGKAAYYSIPPSSSVNPYNNNNHNSPMSRVLFIHGVQTPAIGLQPLAKELSSRFPQAHLVLFDLWGHGLTGTPIVPFVPELFHALIEVLLVHLQWEHAHFLGYSFGGSTTATFAAAKPHRVASMTLVAPAGLLRREQFSEEEQNWIRGGNGIEEEASDGLIGWLEGGELVVPDDWEARVARGEVVAQAVKAWQLENHEGHRASVVAVFRDGGALDRHAEFKNAAQSGIKSFCVLGELDGVCSVKELNDLGFRNVFVVPQVGHGVVRERVVEVAQLIEDFWRTSN